MNENIENIRIYGDPVLRKPTEDITSFDGDLRRLADSMIETMYNHENGIGLSGPQVGVSKKIVVIDLSFGTEYDNVLIMINPEIVETEGECPWEEGCLSVPGIYETVIRPAKVFARFRDIEGDMREIENDEYLARVMLHEVDHLDGILFVDRLSTVKRKLLSGKLRTLAKKGEIV